MSKKIDKYAICSVLPNGFGVKKIIRKNYSTLDSKDIQDLYQDRFDDPSYYHGSRWEKFGGNIDGCDIDASA
jgi:hypothetical protein